MESKPRKVFTSRTARIMLLSMLGTVLIVRVVLHQFPTINLNVGETNIHHLFTGILLLVAAGLPLILRSPAGRKRWILTGLFGIGLGLVLDEWVYMIVTDGTDASYLSPESLVGAIIFTGVAAVYIVILAWRGR